MGYKTNPIEEKLHIKSQFEKIFEHLDEQSDLNKIVEGCFENFLKIQFIDPMLLKVINNY